MGIAWLWHVKSATDPTCLRALNDDRAATVYARWRTVLHHAAELTRRSRESWEERRLERAARLALRDLPEHILRDIGVSRDGVDAYLPEPRPTRRRITSPSALPGEIPLEHRCEPSVASTAQDVARPDAIDSHPRAA